jgi:hypothetical protein
MIRGVEIALTATRRSATSFMDKKTKRSQGERIKRELARALAPSGFQRTKATFWTRPHEHVVQFIHLHTFTYGALFRVHLGIRVLNDTFEAVALNGLSSHDGWYGKNREYLFDFDDTAESVGRCVGHLTRFCAEIGTAWFSRFNDPLVLLNAADSPLKSDAKACLKLALKGQSTDENVRTSRLLLGVAEQNVGPERG